MTSWADRPLACVDLETTGVDPETARIVTAAVVVVDPGGVMTRARWLADPGVEIPAEAVAVHGITTEHARASGTPAGEVAADVAIRLDAAWTAGTPVVAMNASYDLTVVQRELVRHGLPPLRHVGPCLDPLVIDRAMDRYRRGSRKLADLARHYRVRVDGEHSAEQDALTAGRVVWRQARVYPQLREMGLPALQTWQADAHRVWAEGYEAHLARSGKLARVDRSWPWRQAPAEASA